MSEKCGMYFELDKEKTGGRQKQAQRRRAEQEHPLEPCAFRTGSLAFILPCVIDPGSIAFNSKGRFIVSKQRFFIIFASAEPGNIIPGPGRDPIFSFGLRRRILTRRFSSSQPHAPSLPSRRPWFERPPLQAVPPPRR